MNCTKYILDIISMSLVQFIIILYYIMIIIFEKARDQNEVRHYKQSQRLTPIIAGRYLGRRKIELVVRGHNSEL